MDINRVSFSHDNKADVLRGVSGHIAEGAVTTIIGPNGSGKSTLLGVMSGHLVPREGEVQLRGQAVHRYKPKELARLLAVVHQSNEAPADLTVEQLVGYGRLPHRSLFAASRDEDEEAVAWALACTELEAKRGHTLGRLSGGERQRVWLALALAQRTPLLLLDEPTTYLDVYYQLELLELIRRLNAEHGLTIAMVLHDMNQALRYSDSIIAMKDGCVVRSGAPGEVVTEETMREVYGVRVKVGADAEAGPFMVPLGIARR
ncbi:MAG: ABC transporter ATP-binding protein [Paenibacillaceae bacterium]|nr:ABC transporter ATP-binding protein [Paenibacillaceae bacterium]